MAGLYLRYRPSYSKEINIEGYFVYQYIDLGQGDYMRTNYENIFNNQRILLQIEAGQEYFFVNKEERKNCWVDSTIMLKQGKSKIVMLKTKRLLLGGYAPVKNLSIKLSNTPSIKMKS